jgi:ubiquilin
MKKIEEYSSIPPSNQKLIFKGKILKPEEPISSYKIENDSVIIMVKTVSAQNSQPSPAPSNNVSSNPEENITIKVKTNLDSSVHSIPINKNATVLGLKGEIEKVTHVPPAQQKLVIKGRTMKDSDPISTYELNNDSVIAMIKTGGNSQAPGLGGLGGLGDDPLQQQALNAVLNNPQMLNQLLNSPEMRPLLEQNPQMREILQNPQMRQLLLNPQLLQRMGQLGGQGGASPLGGGFGDLENLSVSQNPNTRLGDLFSQWMNEEKNGGSSGTGHAQPQQQQPIFGGEQSRPQPVFQQFPQPDPNVDYKEKYKDQIAQIKEMGIDDEEKIIDALKKCDGNVQYALNRLFG